MWRKFGKLKRKKRTISRSGEVVVGVSRSTGVAFPFYVNGSQSDDGGDLTYAIDYQRPPCQFLARAHPSNG